MIYWSGFDERLLGSSNPSPTSSASTLSSSNPSAPLSSDSGPPFAAPSPPPPRAGVAVAATLPSALRGALRSLPRLALPARAAPAPAALAE